MRRRQVLVCLRFFLPLDCVPPSLVASRSFAFSSFYPRRRYKRCHVFVFYEKGSRKDGFFALCGTAPIRAWTGEREGDAVFRSPSTTAAARDNDHLYFFCSFVFFSLSLSLSVSFCSSQEKKVLG